jgi:glucokinase
MAWHGEPHFGLTPRPARENREAMSLFRFPVLLADIGGTNARFGRIDAPGDGVVPVARLETGAFSSAEDAFAQAMAMAGLPRPCSIAISAAGPLQGRKVELTNAGWTLDADALADACNVAQVLILNDFEAQALALSVLSGDGLQPIGDVPTGSEGVRLAIGPGTGLGVGALAPVPLAGRTAWLPLASEGGHVDVGPICAEETVLWPHVAPVAGRISAECILSGPGLARLHRARMLARGLEPGDLDPAGVTQAALAEPEGEAAQTARLFLRLLARIAGDMAVTFNARGGVYITGGVAPRLLPLLDQTAFRAAFCGKAPMEAMVGRVGTALVIDPHAALRGLAALASDPDAYLVDLAARLAAR